MHSRIVAVTDKQKFILHMATYHTTFKVIYFDKTVFSVFLVIVALMMA
jgi:hypothetical protein